MTALVRVDDTTAPAEMREVLEARCRRLMAERSRLALSWKTRGDRRRLLGEIQDALDEWLEVAR